MASRTLQYALAGQIDNVTTQKALYGYKNIQDQVEHIEDLFIQVGAEIALTVGGEAFVLSVAKLGKVAIQKGFTLVKDSRGKLRVVDKGGKEIAEEQYKKLFAEATKGAAKGLTGCFAPGTQIVTPEGLCNIELLQPGDLVLSADEDNPKAFPEPKRVLNTFRSLAPIWDLTVSGRTLQMTPDHPVYRLGDGWVPVSELVVADRVQVLDGGWQVVEGIRSTDQAIVVHNIEVEDYPHVFCKWQRLGIRGLGAQQ